MNEIDLYWFSGTGNTLRVAQAMAEVFRRGGAKVNLRRIEQADPRAIRPDCTLGIATAVACQSTYPPVWRFVEQLPPSDGTEVFLVDTLAAYSGGIVGPMRSLLEKKGYRPVGAREIRMPSNYFRKSIDPGDDALKTRNGLDEARRFAEDLLARRAKWRKNSLWQRGMNRFSRSRVVWKFVRGMMKLWAEERRCTRCGLCERLCPVGNIRVEGAPPVFADRCIACQRCFSFCPTGAIRIGRKHFMPYRAVEAQELLGE
jgi:ferredoxin